MELDATGKTVAQFLSNLNIVDYNVTVYLSSDIVHPIYKGNKKNTWDMEYFLDFYIKSAELRDDHDGTSMLILII